MLIMELVGIVSDFFKRTVSENLIKNVYFVVN